METTTCKLCQKSDIALRKFKAKHMDLIKQFTMLKVNDGTHVSNKICSQCITSLKSMKKIQEVHEKTEKPAKEKSKTQTFLKRFIENHHLQSDSSKKPSNNLSIPKFPTVNASIFRRRQKNCSYLAPIKPVESLPRTSTNVFKTNSNEIRKSNAFTQVSQEEKQSKKLSDSDPIDAMKNLHKRFQNASYKELLVKKTKSSSRPEQNSMPPSVTGDLLMDALLIEDDAEFKKVLQTLTDYNLIN